VNNSDLVPAAGDQDLLGAALNLGPSTANLDGTSSSEGPVQRAPGSHQRCRTSSGGWTSPSRRGCWRPAVVDRRSTVLSPWS